jgi:hypothetical protein
VVLQLPALPLHCAAAVLALKTDPNTAAAMKILVAFIGFCSEKKLDWRVATGGAV